VKIQILDGYVDEPSCLGVPPYIAPYPRYLAGAVLECGHDYSYLTIDQVRRGEKLRGDILIIIAGPIVPGKYLRGMPISQKEIKAIARQFQGIKILGGSMARFHFYDEEIEGFFHHLCKKDLDACVYDFLKENEFRDRDRRMEEWRRWSIKGSEVIAHHPDFPQPLMVEIDTSRGCVRYFSGGCSFCIEPMYGKPKYRPPEDVIEEVKALSKVGARNFRLGGQACFFSYWAIGVGKSLTPKPNIRTIRKLLRGIREVAPNLRVLHTDNADPAVIAAHPEVSKEAAGLIVKYCTSGNVLAFGMESADPKVIEENNLNATPEDVLTAIKIINDVGGMRGENGLPKLLPGINFLCGLDGESQGTFELNLEFLKKVLNSGLLIRRINIRQVAPVRREFDVRRNRKEFFRFKEKVRKEIDHEMLKRLVPEGTILREVFLEVHEGRTTFGRQIGSYPILVGIPYRTELNRFVNAIVLSHGYRSITAIEHPLNVNVAPLNALSSIPGIGKKRAMRIVRSRPFASVEDFLACLDEEDVAEKALNFVWIGQQ